MKLSTQQIKSILFGAAECCEEDGGLQCYRYTRDRMDVIRSVSEDWKVRANATSGIFLDFYTDSDFFAFSYDEAVKSSSQPGYYFELLINGVSTALIGEETAAILKGEFSICLPQGKNRVTLIFPTMFRARISSVKLTDGATIEQVKKGKRILFLGDSITQGYASKFPSLNYTHRIALSNNCNATNLGIGGAAFDPCLIDENVDYHPDVICVAYGTNDWAKGWTMEKIDNNCRAFFDKLHAQYPTQPIFVILPIWRTNYANELPSGTLLDVRKRIQDIANGYPNTHIVGLWQDIPHDETLYTDGLHPNDDGFAYYANGVLKHLSNVL
ncbi:MAG: SGNH/GDSL hydrolase family protein [Clostridia bacterium]|nr:SGNH/GDSL hydrolase family protein [Clostridia bacterium]